MLIPSHSCLPYLYGFLLHVSEALSMFLPQRNILFDMYSLFIKKQIGTLPFVNIPCKHQSQLERKFTCLYNFPLLPNSILLVSRGRDEN